MTRNRWKQSGQTISKVVNETKIGDKNTGEMPAKYEMIKSIV